MTSKTLTNGDYSVGWVCALTKELAAATVMLDERHSDLPKPSGDQNAYTLGSIGDHNIAITCLPMGDIGNNPAATVASRMTNTFPSIRFWLMVGIGGGVPPKVRLGDIVVSTPVYEYPGVVQWDLGIAQDESFRRIGALDKPPEVLRSAITKLEAHREIHGPDTGILHILEGLRSNKQSFASKYLRSEHLEDNLFRPDFNHVYQSKKAVDHGDEEQEEEEECEEDEEENIASSCRYCDRAMVVKRKSRRTKIKTHYGVVASGNSVMKNAKERDEINQQRVGGHALCFEMEAAGITNNHPCLVIRGICDYSDTHKNYNWQRYAAVVAAAFAKELLGFVASNQVNSMLPAAEVLNELQDVKHTTELNLRTTHKIDMNFVLSKLPSVNEAAFNSFSDQSEPMCHPETRTALLSEINNWALDSQSKCIFWLNGMAGTGKSTISRTIARDFTHRRQLGASFFFKRGEGDRGNASKFFTTIATQLVQSLPDLRLYLKNVLETDPAISTKTMKEQFEKLLFGPLSELAHPLKTLIVIDALDECENEGHITIILRLLARIQSIESVKLRLLVTSRPDLPVRLGFKQIPESHRDFILHEIPRPVIEHDIGAFLRDELPKIREEYNCLPPSGIDIPLNWPSERNMQALIKMAVPLFIFAATMCRFIGETWDWDPIGKLLKVLRYQSVGSLTQLEKTYLPVLTQILKGDITESEKESRIQEFRNIVGSIVILFEPLSTASLAVLLDIPRPAIDRRLHTLHSVLRVPDDPKSPVRLFHLSFHDFLVDSEHKQSQFWIDEKETHKKIAFRCLDLLSKTHCLKEDICFLKKPGSLRIDIDGHLIEKCLPAEVQYACRYWAHHLEQGNCRISNQDKIHNFLDQRFLYWIEALSIIGRANDSVSIIAKLQNLLEPNNSSILGAFLNDANRFLLKNRDILNLAPLQLYSSAIVFAPATSIIRNKFKERIPSWLHRLPKVQKTWTAMMQTLEGHSRSVMSIAFSPDGKLLASGSSDKTIRLWDAATGDVLQTLEDHSDEIQSIAFSPDSKLLASGSNDQTIKLWDAVTGDVLQTLEDHSDAIQSIAFSPDGKLLASGSWDKTIKLWDAVTGDVQQTLKNHSNSIKLIAFSPDGKLLASGLDDKTIQLWDTTTGLVRQTLEGHLSSIDSIVFSLDGKLLASSFNNKIIKLWDIATGDVQQNLEDHSEWIESIAFSPNGKLLASDSRDKFIKLWNIAESEQTLEGYSDWTQLKAFSLDGKLLASRFNNKIIKLWNIATSDVQQTLEGHLSSIDSIAFSPDAKLLASGSRDKVIKLWDIATGDVKQTLEDFSNSIRSIVFSFDGKLLASCSNNMNIKLWNVATGNVEQTLEDFSNSIRSIAFSPDAKLLASGSDDRTLKLWNIATGDVQQTLEGHSKSIQSIAFSPNGKLLASGSYDQTIKLWDIATGDIQQTLEDHWIKSIAFSPNGKLLASGSDDKSIKLWDIAASDVQQTLEGHSESIQSIAFSLDGKLLASDFDDKTIKLWDIATSDVQQTLEGHSESIQSIVFSPDGKLLASGSYDETIKLWDITTGDIQQTLEGHSDWIQSMLFSPDGKLIASGYDETIKFWDIATGDVQQTLEGHSDLIRSIAFSFDGKLLASGSNDETIKLWDIATGDVEQTLEGHSDLIRSIAFSSDGKLLASSSDDRTLKLWDIATGNLQRSIAVDWIVEKLWFHTDEPYLVTNTGLIRIQQSQTDVLPPQSHQISQVFLKDNWIVWNEENIVWLPPEYRTGIWDYRNKVLASACASGLVSFFGIDFPKS